MRLLISCHVGEVSRDRIIDIFSRLGWMPVDESLANDKLEELERRLPDDARQQVAAGNPFAFKPGVVAPWGFASTELRGVVRFRILGETIEGLRREADFVVRRFAEEFYGQVNRECAFDLNVTIRRVESEIELVFGTIENVGKVSLRRFFREQGGVERSVFIFSVLGLLVCLGVSLGLFYSEGYSPTEVQRYWRAYADRGLTAFMVAIVTVGAHLIYLWREWKTARYRIRWGDRGYL